MKIDIKEKKAALVSFDTDGDKFDSDYERNKFFRGLHGWKQIIKKKKKRYCYNREGLLDEIPHFKVAQSAFIIKTHDLDKVMHYLEKWKSKVRWLSIKIKIKKRRWNKIFGDTNVQKE